MSPKQADSGWNEPKATGLLVLADGTVLEGVGFGATGSAVGEVCFNTAMTGYEEILTDPSYAGQIITFTFPHIGNVGTNDEDIETVNLAATPGARGAILRTAITEASNYRSALHLDQWLKRRNIVGLSGIDTRALTALIREKGTPNAVIAHEPSGNFNVEALKKEAREWPGLVGMDLVPMVTSAQRFTWDETSWLWEQGYGRQTNPEFHVVAIDYGIKRNILRLLADNGCKVTVVPAKTPAHEILALNPDGVFLSNGPGDPAATGEYAVPVIKTLIDTGTPTFGICLGHQMLGIALGGRTMKMHQGHHGANHPVKDMTTGKVEITSMNHGFAVDKDSLPGNVEQTHVSLFDGSNCGIALKDKPVFSVQYHPEASPGPRDSHYLFTRFVELMRKRKARARLDAVRYRLAIFDIDGTLVDSFPWFTSVVNDVADRYGFRRIAPDEIDTLRGLGAREIVRMLEVPTWKLPLIARHMHKRKSAALHEMRLFDGVDAMLRRLSECGVGLAVVSSDNERNVRRTLGAELAGLVPHFACGASLFGKAPKFRKALPAAGCEARDAIAVGDEIRDLEAARTVGLAFGAVSWGYTRPDALAARKPDATFHCVADIAETLCKAA